jgi:hypothetical protein
MPCRMCVISCVIACDSIGSSDARCLVKLSTDLPSTSTVIEGIGFHVSGIDDWRLVRTGKSRCEEFHGGTFNRGTAGRVTRTGSRRAREV